MNYPVVLSSAYRDNESSSVSKSISSLSITMSDANNDTFNWSIETSPNIGSCYSNNDSNGSKTCDITNLEYSTTYYWYVNATDGHMSTNESFWFVTEDEPDDPPPPSPPSPPSPPPSPPPYVPPPNIAPSADIGGPYSGFVNESITYWIAEVSPSAVEMSAPPRIDSMESAIELARLSKDFVSWL